MRSDPYGLLVRYEIEASEPPTSVEFDIPEDGEPAQTVEFPIRQGTDSRFFRAFAFKPTVEGSVMHLVLRAYAKGKVVAETSCPGINVVP